MIQLSQATNVAITAVGAAIVLVSVGVFGYHITHGGALTRYDIIFHGSTVVLGALLMVPQRLLDLTAAVKDKLPSFGSNKDG